jgi:hypothetical protein
MAAQSEVEYTTADGNDYPAHEQTYENFLLMALVGAFHVLNVCVALAVGGYKGAWWTMTAIIVVASIVAVHGLATGAKAPSYVMLGISLVILALS